MRARFGPLPPLMVIGLMSGIAYQIVENFANPATSAKARRPEFSRMIEAVRAHAVTAPVGAPPSGSGHSRK
jgi:hypothetical protein